MVDVVVSFIVIGPFILITLFLFAIAGSLITYLRFKVREKMMFETARSFNLQFTSNMPQIKHFLYQDVWPYALPVDWKTNIIEGTINNHNVYIYDNSFTGPRVLLKPLNPEIRHTIIQIDGRYLKGKEPRHASFSLGDPVLTPVYTLRKILDGLQ